MYRLRLVAAVFFGCASGLAVADEYFQSALNKFEGGEYREALSLLDAYAANNSAGNPELHVFRAQAFYRLDDFPSAVHHLERGIAAARQQGSVVKKRWWELMRYLYWQQGQYEDTIRTIQEMDITYPDPHAGAKILELQRLISLMDGEA